MSAEAVDFQSLRFDHARHADQDATEPARHPVVIVGAGPVGLTLAVDLAQRGVRVVLLDNDNTLSTGSRAICFAKRTLEIFDRLGCGQRMVDKGVSWNVGKVFFRDAQVYQFDLLAEAGHESAGPPQRRIPERKARRPTEQRPAFINLQQYYVEGYLAQRAAELPLIDLRWNNKVIGIEQHADHALLTIETPEGPYPLRADHVVACDGSRSALRELTGQQSTGQVFRDRFLIADVKIKLGSPAPGRPKQGDDPHGGQRRGGAASGGVDIPPAERWFWFDPAFHPKQSVLLHMQPDGVWRIDFQLGWDADPEVEKRPENIIPRVKALLANSTMKDAQFELEWASVYTFACTRMAHFRVGRVLFAGDAAHGVSPFGARGANSGVQDADNLGWKLAAVLGVGVGGRVGEALLDTYAQEREFAADENILHSTRATDFITPKSEISRLFRDAVLDLSRHHAFARTLVNSGRLSVPATLHGSALNTPDSATFEGRMQPGAAAADAPVIRAGGHPSWLLRELGDGFTVLVYGDADTSRIASQLQRAAGGLAMLRVVAVRPRQAATGASAGQDLVDHEGLMATRYDMLPGTVYLLRPDQHVCARWREPSAAALHAALKRALAIV